MIEAGPSFCGRAVTTRPGMSKKSTQWIFRLMDWQVRKRTLGQHVRGEAKVSPAGQKNCAVHGAEKMAGQAWRC